MVWLAAGAVVALIPVLILFVVVLGIPLLLIPIFLFQHPFLSVLLVAGTLGILFAWK